MKKRILFILFFVSVICLSGCNSNTSLIEGNSDPEPIKSEDQEIQNFLDVEVDKSGAVNIVYIFNNGGN